MSKRIEIRLDSVDAVNNLTTAEIDSRLHSLEIGETISFTMQEFSDYIHKLGA